MVTRSLTMPRLGETMEEGRIAQWLISPGNPYRRGEPILEIETDKTVAELPALEDGRLIEILRGEGEMVAVGAPIAEVEVAGSPAAEDTAPPEDAAAPPEPARPAPGAARPATAAPGGRRRATPLARRLARQAGLSLDAIRGSGPRGRIEKADVLAAVRGAPDAPVAEAGAVLNLDGGRLAYAATGPADGTPVLLIHGFAADRSAWAALASALSRDGRRVIAPDLPGHGETSIEATEVAALGAPLSALLDATAPERAVEVVAHSLGAAAAVDLATRHQGRLSGLTLIAPAGLGLGIDGDFIRGMAGATGRGELLHLLRRMSETGALPSPEAADRIAAELARGRLIRLAADAVGPLGQRVDILGRLAELSRTMPVRVIVGLADRIIPWDQVTALPPLVALHLVAGAGHMPHWDRPREVLEIIARALGEAGR
jgi:pimeloyl-ACP methyl ester carboxylesterase